MNILEVNNLTISYNKKSVVKNCSFSIKKGEIVVILGASGDGKTSLLKAIAGLLPFEKGSVIYNQNKIKDAQQQLIPGHKEIKLVHQDFGLDRYHTVEENIRLRLLAYDKSYKDARIASLLRLTHLTTLKNQKATEISGGQQQRLAIARALADEPNMLLLDEPFNQLDFQTKHKIETHLKNYIKKNTITTLLVTHNGIEAMQWADRILFMKSGKIVRTGTPQDFFENPQDKYEASFFGPINKIQLNNITYFFRPGIFSLVKDKKFHQKLKIVHHSYKNSGWYLEHHFSFNNQPITLYSQTNLENIKEIFIHPISLND